MIVDKLPEYLNNVNKIKISLMVLFFYIFFLLISLPASVVLSFVTLPQNIKLSSVSGTIWSGIAYDVKLETTAIELGTIQWQLQPLNLIIGELALDISVVKGDEYINSEMKIRSSGKLELTESRFLIDLASLKPLTYAMPFSYSGKVSGFFPSAFIYRNNHIVLDGELSLKKLRLTSPQNLLFGDFKIDFMPEKEGATSAKIKDLGGPISISGQMKLDKKAKLKIFTRLSARDKDVDIENVLSLLGKKDSSGRTEFNYNLQL